MSSEEPKQIGLEDIVITEELYLRSPKTPNLQAENQALHTLARQLAQAPQAMLKTLVSVARELCEAGTAGISLLEISNCGKSIYRWVALAGVLEQYEQGTTPGSFSPCGVCLELRAPQLYLYPERYFTYFQQAQPAIVEGLVIPLVIDEQPLGTLWIVSHDEQRQFDSEDVRLMTSLANFSTAALQSSRARQVALDAGQALHQSQAQMQALLANMPGMVYHYLPGPNSSDRFAFVNSSCRDLFEVEPSVALQDAGAVWNQIHPEDRASFQASVAKAIENCLTWDWQGRIITPSGKLKWIQARSSALQTTDGDVWDGLLIDITDRKQIEAALRDSEELKRRILESSKDCIKVLTPNSKILYINQGGLCLLEIDAPESILNTFWVERWQGEDYENAQAALAAARMGDTSQFQGYLPTVKGKPKWWDSIITPVRDASGQVVQLVVISRDITEAKRIEVTVKASNERLKLLSEVANDLLLHKDPKIFLANLFAKVSTHLGLEVYFNYLFEEDRQRLQLHTYGGISADVALAARYLELGQAVCGYVVQHRLPVIVENALSTTGPLSVPLQSVGIRAYASHPLMVGDRVLGTLGLGTRMRDRFNRDEIELMQTVSNQVAAALERSRLIAELQARAEALVQTNRIKDEFLTVLSHELRTPLNPILGWSSMLRSGKLDEVKTARALETIERNAKLQVQLIEDLLDVSRILRGKLSLNPVPVNLAATVTAALETVQLAAQAKSIQIQTTLDPLGQVLGDSTRLQQVIWNLVANAVKFTSSGGQVKIVLERIGSRAQIQVSDTGKGIHPDFLPYVFEHFRQADSTTTRAFGGLGLGLAIVRHLVELHGGTVDADSPGEGQGATFVVRLPLFKEVERITSRRLDEEHLDASTSSLIPHSSSLPLAQLRVLLVDDDPDTRDLTAFILEQNGALVTSATNAAAAIQAFEQTNFDVLISDIGMPQTDGYMLLRQIRSMTQGTEVLALALTAHAGEINQQQALAAGFQRHIAKPVDPEDVVKGITELIKQGK